MIDTRTTIDFRPRRDEFWGSVSARPDRDGANSNDRGATGFSFGTTDLASQAQSADGASPEMCETGRRVILMKKRDGEDRVVGQVRVNTNDRWVIPVSEDADGTFYAVMPEKVVKSDDGTIVTCERTRSRTAKPNR